MHHTAAVDSTKSGGKFGHMYLILNKDAYHIATGIAMAMVIANLLVSIIMQTIQVL